jgi:hypothetical protein
MNSPTKCESSTNTSNATGTAVQTLVAGTIEMSSLRGRSGIPICELRFANFGQLLPYNGTATLAGAATRVLLAVTGVLETRF